MYKCTTYNETRSDEACICNFIFMIEIKCEEKESYILYVWIVCIYNLCLYDRKQTNKIPLIKQK